MVQRFKEIAHPVFRSISALSRGILKRKKGQEAILFDGATSNTELLFRIIHSVNQLSIYGAVANWCEQFGLTEEEQERENLRLVNKFFDKREVTRSTTLGISFQDDIWKQFATTHFEVRSIVRQNSVSQGNVKMRGLNIACLDLTRTTVMGNLFHENANTHILEQTLNPESLQQFLEEHQLDQLLKFKS